MDISTWIQVIASVLGILISVITLVRDHRIRKDSLRPYVVCTTKAITVQKITYCYLGLKNFGQTGAYITSVMATPGLESFAFKAQNNPFSNMKMQFIAPGQSYSACLCILDREEKFDLFKESSQSTMVDSFDLRLKYIDMRRKKYEEKYHFSLDGLKGIYVKAPEPDYSTELPKDKALNNIAESIYITQAEKIMNEIDRD
ncbi:hypothetical protein [Lactobacillus delbrueckii]|uniref:hypothetical protein n=1 Tax=Lactobacillus delbrueckii TaxID=1584 RepID=UPI0012E30756|nr:hypothetical protein [Lactobacillus delbrueckii]QGT61210.1 hypothetical protein GM421_03800 [Lactobacillus delbrueckii]